MSDVSLDIPAKPASPALALSQDDLERMLRTIVAPLTTKVSELEAQLETKVEKAGKGILSRVLDKLKGFRTLAVGAGFAAAPELADYFGQIDFHNVFGVTPKASMVFGLILIGLRLITKGPVPNPWSKPASPPAA
jgi:hypothetical protein